MKQVSIHTESKKSKELKILPVPYIYISVCFIHQNKNSFEPNLDYHEHNTRISKNIHLNYHRLTRSLCSISHTGSKLYNKLPQHIKGQNKKVFQKEVKNILLTHMPFSINDYMDLKIK